ncbi:hypothetical protein [Brevundimonas naejangsanensis]|uniref:hypothetical protein n=1 Tax=Brevundimonas naejangsanensis TaxID=588932 RepID=UPI00320ACB76
MKAAIVALSLIAPLAVVATPAAAQQDPDERARIEELTRRLNGAPPASQPQSSQSAAPSRPVAAPVAQTTPPPDARQDPAERARIEELTRRLNGAPSAPASAPAAAPRPTSAPNPVPTQTPAAQPQSAQEARSRPAPTPTQPQPRPVQEAPVRRPATDQSAPAPAAGPSASAQSAPASGPQGLSAAERAALPFRIDLPPGFELVEGRSGPGAHVYSARKAGKTYLMIYAGPSSQFPIYDGEQVTVGGRISVVTTEGPRRIAMEHLFQRSGEPAEIHVWLMAQDGADRDEAERIAQTVDPR